MPWPKLRENGAYLAHFQLISISILQIFQYHLHPQLISLHTDAVNCFLHRHPETAEGARQKKFRNYMDILNLLIN